MKIIRVSARDGSPCGTVNLSQLVDGINLENGRYVLSMRDCVVLPNSTEVEGLVKRFSLGKAKAAVEISVAKSAVNVSLESPDICDFMDLYDAVWTHLGIEHEHLPRPKHRLDDLSFVRGLRNDLRTVRKIIANLWRPNPAGTRESLANRAEMDYIDSKISKTDRDDIVSGASSR